MLSPSRITLWLSTGLLLLSASAARANIDLVLEPVAEPCISRVLEVSLYAVSDDESQQSIAAMDVLLAWDPAVLGLLGTDDEAAYPYDWLFSGFPVNSGLDGLNDTWEDGNAYYQALAQLGTPAYATPEGLLVVIFRFEKRTVGEETSVTMMEEYGQYMQTVVYDGTVPALDVTGLLYPAVLTPSPRGDLDCDGQVNAFDIDPLILALTNPAAYAQQYPGCDPMRADCNCDGQVNAFDIDPFIALLTTAES